MKSVLLLLAFSFTAGAAEKHKLNDMCVQRVEVAVQAVVAGFVIPEQGIDEAKVVVDAMVETKNGSNDGNPFTTVNADISFYTANKEVATAKAQAKVVEYSKNCSVHGAEIVGF